MIVIKNVQIGKNVCNKKEKYNRNDRGLCHAVHINEKVIGESRQVKVY